jgi:hypothetical protein
LPDSCAIRRVKHSPFCPINWFRIANIRSVPWSALYSRCTDFKQSDKRDITQPVLSLTPIVQWRPIWSEPGPYWCCMDS